MNGLAGVAPERRFDPGRIEESTLRTLFEYWDGQRPVPGRLPARRDIDPLDIPKLLPCIYVLDVERDPMRFRFRLVGTSIIDWFKRDATGMYMDDPEYGRQVEVILTHYLEVVDAARPRYDHHHSPQLDARYRNYARLMCPLATDGKTVDMLFCGLEPRRG